MVDRGGKGWGLMGLLACLLIDVTQTVVGSALVTDLTTTFPVVSEKDPLP